MCLVFFPFFSTGQEKPSFKNARNLFKESRYAEALVMLDVLIKRDPSRADLFHLRGQCRFGTKDWTSAVDDFKRAVDLDPKERESYEYLAESYFQKKDFGRAMEGYQNLQNTFGISYDFAQERVGFCKVMLGDYDGALSLATNSIHDFPENECFLFIRAMAYDSLRSHQLAVISYTAALNQYEKRKNTATLTNLSPVSSVWYALSLAHFNMFQFEMAQTAVNKCLTLNPDDLKAKLLAGRIYLETNEAEKALTLLEQVVAKNPSNTDALLSRANALFKTGRYAGAIKDYTMLLSKSDTTVAWYINRASCYEAIGDYSNALIDFTKAGSLAPKRSKEMVTANRKRVLNKMYLANKESNPPKILLKNPATIDGAYIALPKSLIYAKLSGIVEDQSLLKSITINGMEADFFSDSLNPSFDLTVPVQDKDSVLLRAVDVYNNITTLVYKFSRTEKNKPAIQLFVGMDPLATKVVVDASLNKILAIDGRISDESFIKSIRINGIEASFPTRELNPVFSIEWKVHRTDSLVIEVEDEFGNYLRKAYEIDSKTARLNLQSPMGNTWVVFIENSHYRDLESLTGPGLDVKRMVQAFNGYQVSNKLIKKDLNYQEMDKFFRIELRDMIKQNKVTSLLIWFAGHGKFLNDAGYWIPVDASKNDEASFFPVANLGSYLKTYGISLKHILIVSDACEGGKAFYTRNTALPEDKPCKVGTGEIELSAEVFSSTSNERASDRSVFASAFASALEGSNNPCISIGEVVRTVTPAVEKNQRQYPRYGQITSLPNKGGTFTFLRQNP